jgi:hypothetical protein
VTAGVEIKELQNGVAFGFEIKHDRMLSFLQASGRARDRVTKIVARVSVKKFILANVVRLRLDIRRRMLS